jgi:hypothetical protein
MSFREKMHWVAFAALGLAFGWYFLAYPWGEIATPTGVLASATMLLPVTLAILGGMTLASAFFALRSPREATLKDDERDRAIHMRGTHLAYYPLVLGAWANMIAIFHHLSPGTRLNLLIGTVVLAEMIRVGGQLYAYRKGR